MPGKIKIKNLSQTNESVTIKLSSLNDATQEMPFQKIILGGSSIETVVKGGVKLLSVYFGTDGDVWWQGIIPTYGAHSINIVPSKKCVLHGDRILANFLSDPPTDKVNINPRTSSETIIIIVVLVIMLILLMWWIYKK